MCSVAFRQEASTRTTWAPLVNRQAEHVAWQAGWRPATPHEILLGAGRPRKVGWRIGQHSVLVIVRLLIGLQAKRVPKLEAHSVRSFIILSAEHATELLVLLTKTRSCVSVRPSRTVIDLSVQDGHMIGA